MSRSSRAGPAGLRRLRYENYDTLMPPESVASQLPGLGAVTCDWELRAEIFRGFGGEDTTTVHLRSWPVIARPYCTLVHPSHQP